MAATFRFRKLLQLRSRASGACAVIAPVGRDHVPRGPGIDLCRVRRERQVERGDRVRDGRVRGAGTEDGRDRQRGDESVSLSRSPSGRSLTSASIDNSARESRI